MAYLMASFFSIGILFGNINALAMQPLGHLAGTGAAVVGALSTLISMLLGTAIGQSYNGRILPLVIGIAALTGMAILVARWAEAKPRQKVEDDERMETRLPEPLGIERRD